MWVQTDAPCEVEVRPRAAPPRASGRSPSRATTTRSCTSPGCRRTRATPYEVALDGEVVWPRARQPLPAERPAHAHAQDAGADRLRLLPRRRAARAAAHAAQGRAPRGPRGRRAARPRAADAPTPPEEWPHALLLLGDQVYADEVHPARRGASSTARRSSTYDDYVKLYIAAWGEPVIRWLLSTVPSAMIFDDHDVHDDWNTSIEWVTEMRQKDVVAQADRRRLRELPDLPAPREPLAVRARRSFELYEHLRTADDPTPRLREFAKQADEEVEGTRWSFCRDIGPARVVMIDSRAGRVLDPGQPLDGRRRGVATGSPSTPRGDVDHLLIGTSLPLIMGPAMHWLEAWNEVVADGAWGKLVKKVAEKLRQELDLEHWPAFQDVVPAHVRPAARGRRRPARRGAVDDLRALAATSTTPTWPRSASRPGSGVRVRGLAGGLLAVPQPARHQRAARSSSPPGRGAAGLRHARARPPRRRARSRRRAGGSRTRSRGSTTRSRCSSSRAGAPRSCSRRRSRRRTGRASPCWSACSNARSNPTPSSRGLKTHSARWGHDQVANRLEPLRTT